MTPKESYGNKPMSSAERVKRTRWVRRFEKTAFTLIELLNEAPEPLPRQPEIPAELLDKLRPFIRSATNQQSKKMDSNTMPTRVLKLGNGNQITNKKKAIQFIAQHINAQIVDKNTVSSDKWGLCHVAAYTDFKGAMISTPNRADNNYEDVAWHLRNHIIMFRDVGDGRCIIYVCKIEPLFGRRTIGHHGVKWEDIQEIASHVEVLKSEDILKKLGI
jgi:hypothetical protein